MDGKMAGQMIACLYGWILLRFNDLNNNENNSKKRIDRYNRS